MTLLGDLSQSWLPFNSWPCSPLSDLQNDRLAFGEEAWGKPAGTYKKLTKISVGTKPTKFSVGTKLFCSKWTNLVLAIMGDLFKVDKTCFSHFEGLSDFCWSVPLSALQYDYLTFGEEARWIPAWTYEQGTKISVGTKPTKFSVGTKLFCSKWTNLVLAIMGDLFVQGGQNLFKPINQSISWILNLYILLPFMHIRTLYWPGDASSILTNPIDAPLWKLLGIAITH